MGGFVAALGGDSKESERWTTLRSGIVDGSFDCAPVFPSNIQDPYI